MAEPRRIYAKFRFEWNIPPDASRANEVKWLWDQILDAVQGVEVIPSGEGEVDDA